MTICRFCRFLLSAHLTLRGDKGIKPCENGAFWGFSLSALTTLDLNERQAAFVTYVTEGFLPTVAAEKAGYKSPGQSAITLQNSPAIRAAIFQGVQRALQADAAASLRVLRKIREDDAAPARVRADVSLQLMKLAGHTVPTTQEGKAQKALSDMTRDEMVAFIEQNQAAIDRAEQELMSRAKDISAPDSVPIEQGMTANPTEYLD